MSSKNKPAPALHIEYLALDELLRWPGNPKEHAEEAISASVTRFGFRDPLAIDETTGRLIAGHGRLTVLERARASGSPAPQYVQQRADGMWLVPVTRGGSFGSEEEASAYLVAHNRTGELGGWNDELLAGLLSNLDDDLRGVAGFDLDGFLQEQTAAAPPLPPVPPSEFLNDLIGPAAPVAAASLASAPAAPHAPVVPGAPLPPAPPAATSAPTITTPPVGGAEEYVQVAYVVTVSERTEALAVIKDARARFGTDTAPAAFMALIRAYAQQHGISA